MIIEKPLISILMAVYNPRMDWLKEQLDSLNAQTYPNLHLYIRDDCSTFVPFEDVKELVKECITAFPFTILRNEKNLGSNKTFECLTTEAEGSFFAFCDQDDIWMPDKLDKLYITIEKERAGLVCSDMQIINSDGEQTADSITKIRRHHVFRSGTGLSSHLLVTNFVTGCTALIRSEIAKEAIPFCPYMVHDHYLAFYASLQGKIVSIAEKYVLYRVHDHNQTPVMAGVLNRETYLQKRIELLISRLNWLQARFGKNPEVSLSIIETLSWAMARRELFLGNHGAWKTVLKYRYLGPSVSLFEIITASMPDSVFMFFIRMTQKNII